MEVVKSYLKESVKDFNLFRSPPKVVLKPDATLMCLGLVPASRLFWCWSPEPVIKPEFVSHLSSFESVHKVYKETVGLKIKILISTIVVVIIIKPYQTVFWISPQNNTRTLLL
jgi:hypothetical protein